MTEYSDFQLLKRSFYAMRNGVIADALRKGGSPFQIIFGLNLPQLSEIASRFPHTKDFAEKAWANNSTRESMLIAPMLMPTDEFAIDDAKRWISQIHHIEVADILCLKLLRKMPFALDLANELMENPDDMQRYAGLRLMCNLAPQYPALAVDAGRREKQRQCTLTMQVALTLLSYDM